MLPFSIVLYVKLSCHFYVVHWKCEVKGDEKLINCRHAVFVDGP